MTDQERLNSTDPELREKMVACLRRSITPGHKEEIREAIAKDPNLWWALYHHGWGTGVRNLLRDCGFGEKDTGLDNLDNFYVPLVEEAVREN